MSESTKVPEIYIGLQTPSIELKIKAMDSSGQQESLFAGYQRADSEESEKLLESYNSIVAHEDFGNAMAEAELFPAMRERILYLRDVQLLTVKDDKLVPFLKVPDTRRAKDNADLWGDADNCLSFLLDMYLRSTPWRSAFIEGYMDSLVNSKELSSSAKLKNF